MTYRAYYIALTCLLTFLTIAFLLSACSTGIYYSNYETMADKCADTNDVHCLEKVDKVYNFIMLQRGDAR